MNVINAPVFSPKGKFFMDSKIHIYVCAYKSCTTENQSLLVKQKIFSFHRYTLLKLFRYINYVSENAGVTNCFTKLDEDRIDNS